MTSDRRGIISEVNRQVEMLTGYKRDELIGTPFRKPHGSLPFTDAE